MDEPLNAIESALLQVFREQGVILGDPIPTDVLVANVSLRGGAPVFGGSMETALLNLQFRGLIAPGPDPYSATTYVLTQSGAALLRSPRGHS
jgi:hypothetical protein